MSETKVRQTPRPTHPGTDGQEGPNGRLVQTVIPDLAKMPRKRRSLIEQAVVGDIVIALDGAKISSIEQVSDNVDGPMIVERWKDQLLVGASSKIEVWELRPGGYYRRRRAGR